ncbi:hypothetical protein [Collimonas sp.]|jgi:hypothetical protein
MTPVSLSTRNPYFGMSHLLRNQSWPLRMLPYVIPLLITPAMLRAV